MPGTNIFANRVYTQIGTSYEQGKALRLAQRNEDLQMERQRQQMEHQDAEMERAARQEQRQVDQDQRKQETDRQAQRDEFWESVQPLLEKGDFETTKLLADYRDMPDLTQEIFDAQRANLAKETATYGTTPHDGMKDGRPVKFVQGTDGSTRILDEVGVAPEEAKGSAVNVLLPNGERQSGIELPSGVLVDPETGEPFPKGTTQISQQITTDSPGGMTGSQAGSLVMGSRKSYDNSNEINESIADVLPKIIDMPGVAGTGGRIAAFAGATATILMSEEAGNAASELFSGVDQETLAKVHTQMQLLRSRLRPIVTGEEGSRQSETERQLANQAIGYIDTINSVTDLAQAYPKVIGSLKQLAIESYVNQYNKAKQHPEYIDYPFDLNTDEGVDGLMLAFARSGLDEDTAVEAYARLKRIQNDR